MSLKKGLIKFNEGLLAIFCQTVHCFLSVLFFVVTKCTKGEGNLQLWIGITTSTDQYPLKTVVKHSTHENIINELKNGTPE